MIKDNFDNNGVTVVNKLVSVKEVNNILKDINLFYENNKDTLEEGKEVNFADNEKKIINSLHRLENYDGYFFHELAKRNSIISLAENLLDCEVKLLSIQSFVKPGKKGLAAPYHQDNAYWCIQPSHGLTIWIALDDCSSSNGMVKYIKGSHTQGVYKHTPSLAPGSSQIILDKDLPKGDIICPTLSPGDAAIHHTMNVHGSNPNITGNQRRSLLLCYCSKNSNRNKKLYDRYQENLAELISLRRNNNIHTNSI